MNNTKTFEEILDRLRVFEIPETFDAVVAIARGGIIPGGLVAEKLSLPLRTITLRKRNDDHSIAYDTPILTEPLTFDPDGLRLLLVDDRVKTGDTFTVARQYLSRAKHLRTFTINGLADYSLYNEPCFRFPWIGDSSLGRDTPCSI